MKIEKLLLGLFASFLMVGCSQNDDLPNGGEEAKGKDSYLSIKINSDAIGSRANDTYIVGDDTENKVNSVLFFFFDAQGNAFNVPVPDAAEYENEIAKIERTKSKDNYIFVTNIDKSSNGAGASNNIEKILDAVVVFKVKDNVYPSSVVAVLNWDYSGNGLSLSSLATQIVNEQKATTSNAFVMSNSVYMKEDFSAVISAQSIGTNNFAVSPTEAKKDEKAIKIYVERLAVKVTTTVNNTATDYKNIGGAHLFKVVEAPDVDNNSGTEIYAKLINWDINTTAQESNLVKEIKSDWNADSPYSNWNDAGKFRSYYAVSNSSQYKTDFVWSTDIKNEFGKADYCLENTDDDNQTKVLVKAQLGTVSGETFTPQTIYQWYSSYYPTVESFKNAIVEHVKSKIIIESKNITITPLSSSLPTPTAHDVYRVKVSAEGTNYKDANGNDLTSEQIAAIFAEIPTAKVWSQGATYYFTKILHHDDAENAKDKYAVIRNHAYSVSIEGVKGLGTPVYVPEGTEGEEPKIPEPVVPEETETYIAAKINVLSWRLVNNNVVLGQ